MIAKQNLDRAKKKHPLTTPPNRGESEHIAYRLQLAKEGRDKEGKRGHVTDPTTQKS
jgi:hypothetical protein